jgi:homoserine kinase
MRVVVPGTSANLGPGFDTLGLAVSIKNQVIIKPAKFSSISLKGEGSTNPKLKDNNMFVNTFNAFHSNISSEKQNYRFEFINEVPLTRGLGSSSAVIISAIASAYAIENIQIDKQKILNLALSYESHPDNITPAVMGGFTVASVKEHEVNFIKKEMPNEIKAVIVIPNRPISTHQARKALPLKYTKEDTIFNISHSSLLTAAMFSENWDMLRYASLDRIHQYYRMKQMPELFAVRKVALRNGALMSTLSGSGSTFFNLVHECDSQKILEALKKNFPHFRVLCVDMNNNGLEVEY